MQTSNHGKAAKTVEWSNKVKPPLQKVSPPPPRWPPKKPRLQGTGKVWISCNSLCHKEGQPQRPRTWGLRLDTPRPKPPGWRFSCLFFNWKQLGEKREKQQILKVFLKLCTFNCSMWDGNASFDPANRFSADKNKGWEKWPPPKDQKVKSDKIKHTPTFVETSSAKVHSHLHYLWTIAHHQDELLKLLRPQAFLSPTRRQGQPTKKETLGFPKRHKQRIANKQRKGNEQRNLRFHKITHQNLRAQEFQGTVHQRHLAAAVQLQGLLFALLLLQKALSSQLEAPGPTKLKLVTLLLLGGTHDKRQEFGRQVYVTVVNDILSYKIDIISLN